MRSAGETKTLSDQEELEGKQRPGDQTRPNRFWVKPCRPAPQEYKSGHQERGNSGPDRGLQDRLHLQRDGFDGDLLKAPDKAQDGNGCQSVGIETSVYGSLKLCCRHPFCGSSRTGNEDCLATASAVLP